MVSDDVRWLLFIYATKVKGIHYRELGITRAYGNMLKNSRRRITDDLLDKILDILSAKDLLIIMYSLNEIGIDARARRLAWLGRRLDEAEVRGSSPRGPIS